MVVFKIGLKLISWIELLSTLWFFLNLFYLVWNVCVRIVKEMRNSSWKNLCFLSAKFFYRLQDNKVIIQEITLRRQLVFQRLNSWKFWRQVHLYNHSFATPFLQNIFHQFSINKAYHFHIHFSQKEFLFIHHAFPYCHFPCNYHSPSFPQ